MRLALPLLALALALAGAVSADPLTRTVPAGGTAVVALPGEIETMDPARATGLSTWRALSCLYETLVRPGERPGQVRPGLAASWESGAGGREWTFHLRRDVYFHDGQPLTAAAAARALRRQFDPQVTPSSSVRGQFVFWRSLVGSGVRSVTPLDSHTLRVVLSDPVQDFLEILAHPPCAIVSPASSEARPVGTGPFRFLEWRAGQRLTLESNLHYWGGRPPLDHVVFTVVPSAPARSRELVRGNADLATALDPLQADSLRASVTLWASAGLNGWFLAMNCSRPPWSDIRARLALQHAVPRADLVRRFLGTRGAAAKGVLSPRCWAYDASLPAYGFDAERAKRLMHRVKLRPGFRAELLYPSTSPVAADPYGLALQVARRLAAAGLPATPVAVEPEDLDLRLRRGSYDLALLLEERGLADPDVSLYPAWARDNARSGGTNWSRFQSGRLQGLLEMGRTVPDAGHRKQVYREVQQQLQQAAPAVPLAWALEVLGRRRGFHGVEMDRLGVLDFRRAWLEHR